MPRRNQREAHEPLTITPADLAKGPKVPKPRRQPGDYQRDLNPSHRRRLEAEDARAAQTTCCIPMCTSDSIWDSRKGYLGICSSHGIDVAIYFDKMNEDAPEVTERLVQRVFRARQRAERAEREEQQTTSRTLEPGWIYYLRIDDRIKIGYSVNVKQRMRAYPPNAHLLAVHPGTKTLEKQLHHDYRSLLVEGREWFRDEPTLMSHIDAVIEQFGKPGPEHIHKYRSANAQQVRPNRARQRSRYLRTSA